MLESIKFLCESRIDQEISSPCITDNAEIARKCALLTISEVSDLLDGVGEYNRRSAYTALALGTITGGVLAFDGGEDVLKGLAVFSGGVLGLNAVVDTATQRVIYEKALKDLSCSVRAFDALQAASEKQKTADAKFINVGASSPIKLYSATSRLANLHQEDYF